MIRYSLSLVEILKMLLNVFRIIGTDLQKRFEKNMNPRYNLFVSRADGKANKEVCPDKDLLIAFWAFNNL